MILMKGRIRVNAAFELNIVLQNELNMTRWDPKIRPTLLVLLLSAMTSALKPFDIVVAATSTLQG